eukprot:15459405-Alexandrium_andersonii.AAC.1
MPRRGARQPGEQPEPAREAICRGGLRPRWQLPVAAAGGGPPARWVGTPKRAGQRQPPAARQPRT